MAVSDPPPSSPTPQSPSLAVTRGSTPTSTVVRAYLQPVTSLDSESLDTLKSLLRITVDLRRSTSQTHRIRRGSPGAGALGATLASLQPRLEEIANRVSEVLKTHQDFPGMYQISRQFPEFRDVLNGRFNDGGNDPGYNERVHLLEKLMYVAGTLRGHVELVLEQHAYWRAKLSGERPSRLARRLDFDLAVDPAAVGVEQLVNEAALVAENSLQRELPSSDQTFKVSVSLPQELHAALAHIWEEQKFTDVDFLISGQVVPAHKAVLASQSQYFESMLYGSMREAAMNEVELKDVPVPAFRKVLQFTYTGSLDMENVALQSILEVSSVADRFGFVSLKEALGDQLSQNYISLDTVLLLLVHSDIYHLQQLHSSCVVFIENRENSVQVLRHPSLLHLPMESLSSIISRDTFVAPEIEILRAIQQWKEHNAKEVKEITELLECIRLSEFSSPEQIFKEVEPTGLLDSQRILAGIRTICKPCLTEMRPRGKKESNNNLFTKPRVVFDSTTPQTFSHQPTHRQQHLFQGPPPQCYVADTVILLGEGSGLFYGQPRHSMIIALDDLYIINCLSIKGHPSDSDEQQTNKCFSYKVSISRDKQSWLKLFDYSSFACWGTQDLLFPRQAARFLQMELKWKEDKSGQLPLRFSSCCFASDPRPFSFLPNGVIAPQYERSVVSVSWSEGDGERQTAIAHFRQPYSISFLRFSLECSDQEVESLDISVSVGLLESGKEGGGGQNVNSGGRTGLGHSNMSFGGGLVTPAGGGGLFGGGGLQLGQQGSGGLVLNQPDPGAATRQQRLKGELKLEEFDKAQLNCPLKLEMKEKTVNYVVVAIRKIHRKHPAVSSTTESAGFKQIASSAGGSLPYIPATSSGAAKLITPLRDTPTTTSYQRPTPKPRGGVGDAPGVMTGAGTMHPTLGFIPTTLGGTMQPVGPMEPTFGGTMQPGGLIMPPTLGGINLSTYTPVRSSGHPRFSQHCDIQGLQAMKPQSLAQVVPHDAATVQPPQPPQDYETSRPALFKIVNVVVKSSIH